MKILQNTHYYIKANSQNDWSDNLKITKVQKDTGKSYSVFINGEFSFKVPDYVLFKLGIYEYKDISEKELAWFKNQAKISFAKSIAIKFVSYKIRTIYEVERKLHEDFEPDIIREIIEFLTQNGYLNDKLFAEKFILEKMKLGNLSIKAIEYELYERGISRHIVDEKLMKLEYNESIYAKNLLEKRLRESEKNNLKKIKEYLYRKGFSISTINQIINEYEGEG